MTNREFLTAIASMENAPAEVVEYATERLAKLDAANEARKGKPSKKALAKAAENAPMLDRIMTEILSDTAVTAGAVAETLGVSTPKASALLRSLVAEGKAVSADIKVTGKGTCKGYALA